MRNVDSYPPSTEFLGGVDGRPTAAERVENHITRIAARFEYAFEKRNRFLCGIAEPLGCHRIDRPNVVPNIADWHPFAFVQIAPQLYPAFRLSRKLQPAFGVQLFHRRK